MIPGGRMISTPTVMPPTNDTLRRGRCPHRPASGQRPPLQYTQHPFTISRRGRPMWRPAVGRDDPACRLKFAFCPSRGPDFRRRTGDISPPGEVLSMDGKYPKIPGSADPDPKRTFGKRSKFVRRGCELGVVPSSARCRSCQSNQVPLFFHIAPLVCLAFSASVASFLAPCRAR